jgi:hypothetical protein
LPALGIPTTSVAGLLRIVEAKLAALLDEEGPVPKLLSP